MTEPQVLERAQAMATQRSPDIDPRSGRCHTCGNHSFFDPAANARRCACPGNRPTGIDETGRCRACGNRGYFTRSTGNSLCECPRAKELADTDFCLECLGGGKIAKGVYCECPAAAEAKRQDEERWAEERARKQKALREQLTQNWEAAGIPKRFQRFTLDTSPLCQTAPELIERLRYPAQPAKTEADDDYSPEDEAAWDAFLERTEDLLKSWMFKGPVGTGKTGLAVAMAWEIMSNELEQKLKLAFATVPNLLSEIRSTYSEEGGSEWQVMQRYIQADLLILDDLGAEQIREKGGWVEDRLFQIIGNRHDEEKTTIFTSNLGIDAIAQRLGDRIAWRIVEMCADGAHVIDIEGPNLRNRRSREGVRV